MDSTDKVNAKTDFTLSQTEKALRIGVDIGGTFTDFVILDPISAEITTFKLLTTPNDPGAAVLEGIQRIREDWARRLSPESGDDVNSKPGFDPIFSMDVVHGSTVATNALLERKGANTALVTTHGFKDVIEIGRQNRPKLYDLTVSPPEPLIPAQYRFEVLERIDHQGEVLTPLDENAVDNIVAHLKVTTNKDLEQRDEVGGTEKPNHGEQDPVESIAVVLLFSFLHPEHERTISRKLRQAGYFVSASHEVLPEYREYERTSTTVINAYVSPILDRYLQTLEVALIPSDDSVNINKDHTRLRVMQSNGGSIHVDEARKMGVRCILSGPAGGVVGAKHTADRALKLLSPAESSPGPPTLRLLTFDMGGTSTDVCLIHGEAQISTEAKIGGHPICLPVIDIHTIGAGGGSIASVDAGGALRVGPQSAGADPGPACYGRSSPQESLPTVTDANLVLGRISPEHFLGGEMRLKPDLANLAVGRLGERLGLSLTGTALGIIEIANAHMERALRVISVERGHDPHDYTLLSFGGAGGLHAADLARRLGVPRVLVPPYAATLSAYGMLCADVVKDHAQTVMLPGDTPAEQIAAHLAPLVERVRQEVLNEGISPENITVEERLDLRYRGQSYELMIPFGNDFTNNFHTKHRQTYGYERRDAPIEIVNLRVRATGHLTAPQLDGGTPGDSDPTPAYLEKRPVTVEMRKAIQIPFYRGEALNPGNLIDGPAIILREDTTILVGMYDQAEVDPYRNLIIQVDQR